MVLLCLKGEVRCDSKYDKKDKLKIKRKRKKKKMKKKSGDDREVTAAAGAGAGAAAACSDGDCDDAGDDAKGDDPDADADAAADGKDEERRRKAVEWEAAALPFNPSVAALEFSMRSGVSFFEVSAMTDSHDVLKNVLINIVKEGRFASDRYDWIDYQCQAFIDKIKPIIDQYYIRKKEEEKRSKEI